MEALGLILIAGALFCHSWHILGLYSDGRTVGVSVAALGLAALIAATLDPMLLIGGDAEAVADAGGDAGHKAYSIASGLAETTLMKTLIVGWAVYAVAVGAQVFGDYDERPIGFYSAILAVVGIAALLFFAGNLTRPYGENVAIALSAAALAMSLVSAMLFFYLAIPFNGLRPVAGWFALVGSVAIFLIGILISTKSIVATLA